MSVISRYSCIIVFYFDGTLRNPASFSRSERSLNNHLCFYVYVTLQNDLYIATVLKKGKSYVQQILTVAAGFQQERSSIITKLIPVDVSRVSVPAFIMSSLLRRYSDQCYRIKWISPLLVCSLFIFCHLLAFLHYTGVYCTFGLLDCIRYNEDFVISRLFSINLTATLVGLKNIDFKNYYFGKFALFAECFLPNFSHCPRLLS